MFTIQSVLNITQLLCLILITGGTITLGALAAPTLFKNLNREEAGTVMIDIFKKFDSWIKFSAILLLAAKLIEIGYLNKFNFFIETQVGEELTKSLNTPMLVSFILVLVIVAISLHLAVKLSPQIIESYEQDSPEFESLHKQSEVFHRLNFVFGLFLLFSFA